MKVKAIRDIYWYELLLSQDDKSLAIPIGTIATVTTDWGDNFIGVDLPEEIRNPYDSTQGARWLAVPREAFEVIDETQNVPLSSV